MLFDSTDSGDHDFDALRLSSCQSSGWPADAETVLAASADASGPVNDADVDAMWAAEMDRRDAELSLADAVLAA